jgi:hypothetical protein
MRLIKKILGRNQKADVPYIKRTFSLLKKSVNEIHEASMRLYKAENFKKEKSIEVRTLRARLTNALRRLDEAIAMYFNIDELREGYTLEEKQYLGELQKYWYGIRLDDLPATQWDIIVRTIKKFNLSNAKVLINLGNVGITSSLYSKQ